MVSLSRENIKGAVQIHNVPANIKTTTLHDTSVKSGSRFQGISVPTFPIQNSLRCMYIVNAEPAIVRQQVLN